MIRNNNSALSQELRDVLKIQVGSDPIPALSEAKIMPVIDVNPKHARIVNYIATGTKSTTGSGTLITLPTDRDIYITNISYTVSADANADNTSAGLLLTPDGNPETVVLQINKITLTAINQTLTMSYPIPIKLKRNSLIRCGSTFTVGACVQTVCVQGYFVDNQNA